MIPYQQNAVVAIGNFDGVHLAHQHVIKTASSLAKKLNTQCGVITFTPHPVEFFNKQFKYINTEAQKIDLLKKLEVDFILNLPFNKELSALNAEEFVIHVLVEKLKVKYVVTGYNFHFGKDRAGDPTTLEELSNNLEFKYICVDEVDFDGIEVSSSRIKNLISMGRVNTASKLLGRYFCLSNPTTQIIPLPGIYNVQISQNEYGICYISKLGEVRVQRGVESLNILRMLTSKSVALDIASFEVFDQPVSFIELVQPFIAN